MNELESKMHRMEKSLQLSKSLNKKLRDSNNAITQIMKKNAESIFALSKLRREVKKAENETKQACNAISE